MRPRQSVDWRALLAGRLMIGDDHDSRRFPPIGERDAERRGSGDACGDSGDDFERHAGGFERVNFLGQASEDSRVAALQANDFQAAARGFDHARVDFGLGRAFGAVALADARDFGLRRGQRKDRWGHEIVMQNHGGASDEPLGLDGQQVRVAGAGADQINFAFGYLCHCRIAVHTFLG